MQYKFIFCFSLLTMNTFLKGSIITLKKTHANQINTVFFVIGLIPSAVFLSAVLFSAVFASKFNLKVKNVDFTFLPNEILCFYSFTANSVHLLADEKRDGNREKVGRNAR